MDKFKTFVSPLRSEAKLRGVMRTVAFLGVLLAVLMTGVSTTAFILDQYYYEHCRIVAGFAEEDYFVIQWNLTATTIKFGVRTLPPLAHVWH